MPRLTARRLTPILLLATLGTNAGGAPNEVQPEPVNSPGLEVEVGPGPFYVGQLIGVRIRHPEALETPVRVVEPPASPGVRWIQPVPPQPGRPALLLLAERAGPLVIPSLQLEGEFSVARTRPVRIEVRPLPTAGRSADFRGGVGALQVRSSVNTTETTVGDWVEYTLEWIGPGAVMARAPETPDGLVSAEQSLDVRTGPETRSLGEDPPRRRFRWSLRAGRPGSLQIPPQRVATFDPSTGRYLTRSSRSQTVRIRARPTFPATDPARATDAAQGPSRSWRSWPTLPSLLAQVLTGLLLLAAWSALKRRRRRPDRVALRLARRLEAARAGSGRSTAMVRQALAEYLAARCPAVPAALTPAEAAEAVEAAGGTPSQAAEAGRLLALCDQIDYGEAPGAVGDLEWLGLWSAAAALLRQLSRPSTRVSQPARRASPTGERAGRNGPQ